MQQSFNSRGTIYPSRFVKVSGSQDNSVEQCGANGNVYGVSAEWAQKTPLPSATNEAAASGELIKVYTPGETCTLELGGTVLRGDYLKSDADGKGVTIASSGTANQQVGAVALESGASGEIIRVGTLRFSQWAP